MIRLHFRQYGSGPPLIILHGLFGSSDNWHSLARRWSASFTVYVPDQRNHGSSPHTAKMSYEELAADLGDFMQQRGLNTGYLLGHSMGGKTAMRFAGLHPERVRALAVLDIGPSRTQGQHRPILDALRQLEPETFSSRRDLDTALREYVDRTAVRQFLLKNILRRVDGSLAWKFNAGALLEHYENLAAALPPGPPFAGPVLFLKGADSPYLPRCPDTMIQRAFPQAACLTIPRAGHWLHAEQPDRVFTAVQTFFKEH